MARITPRAARPGFGFWDTLFQNPLLVVLAGIGLVWFVYSWLRQSDWARSTFWPGSRDVAWDNQVVYGGMQAPASRSDDSSPTEVYIPSRPDADRRASRVDELGNTAEQPGNQEPDHAGEPSDQVEDIVRSGRTRGFTNDYEKPTE